MFNKVIKCSRPHVQHHLYCVGQVGTANRDYWFSARVRDFHSQLFPIVISWRFIAISWRFQVKKQSQFGPLESHFSVRAALNNNFLIIDHLKCFIRKKSHINAAASESSIECEPFTWCKQVRCLKLVHVCLQLSLPPLIVERRWKCRLLDC
jgi:hypothetical protein